VAEAEVFMDLQVMVQLIQQVKLEVLVAAVLVVPHLVLVVLVILHQ
jgi:hypothetical protein